MNNRLLGAKVAEFALKSNPQQSVVICNCHGTYSGSSIEHEESIQAALAKGNSHRKIAVVGDLNVTCLNTNPEIGGISTAATPSKLSNNKKQGVNSLDAGYCSITNSDGNVASAQASRIQLNPVTGKAYDKKELLTPLLLADGSIHDVDSIEKMRIAVNIGNQKNSMLINGMSMAQYEEHLRKNSPFDSIYLLPENFDRKNAQSLLPNVVYLRKEQNSGKVFIEISSSTGKLFEPKQPKELLNIDATSLKFPRTGDAARITIDKNKALFDQVKSQEPKWKSAIYVREATNMLNERGIAIQVPRRIFEFVKDRQPTILANLEFRETGETETQEYTTILCKKENIPDLHAAMEKALNPDVAKKAEERYQQMADELVSKIELAKKAYKKLHPVKGNQAKEFEHLIERVNSISETAKTQEQRFYEIQKVLEFKYGFWLSRIEHEEIQKYNNVRSPIQIHIGVLNRLNAQPEKHHFTRMIALLLNDIYHKHQAAPIELNIMSRSSRNECYLHKWDLNSIQKSGVGQFASIKIPEKEKKLYSKIFPESQASVAEKRGSTEKSIDDEKKIERKPARRQLVGTGMIFDVLSENSRANGVANGVAVTSQTMIKDSMLQESTLPTERVVDVKGGSKNPVNNKLKEREESSSGEPSPGRKPKQ